MKKLLFLGLSLIFISSILYGYQIGDTVDDFSWQDSDGGDPQDKSLYELTSDNKIVMAVFSASYCGPCNTSTPGIQVLWEAIGPENFYVVQGLSDIEYWSHLNGAGWRTKFDPPLTYWLSAASGLPTHYWTFGDGYIPYYIVLDTNNVLRHSSTSRPTENFIQNLISEINGDISVSAFRFFNTVSGGHLYTISEIERDYIIDNLHEWNYEGPVFQVHNSYAPDTIPAYRFFNTTTGIHLYTISEHERDTVMDLPEWTYEGLTYYVYPEQEEGTIPMFRFFNHIRGGHLYTISEHERDIVMDLPEWTYEGITFYVLPGNKGYDAEYRFSFLKFFR